MILRMLKRRGDQADQVVSSCIGMSFSTHALVKLTGYR
jgi:hypothetical protein